MRIDLISAGKIVAHNSVSSREVAALGQWIARPRTLRLTTRPRPPVNPDGSRPRSFTRISKSCDMPSIAFDSLKSIEEIAETSVHNTLLPLFRKLHPGASDWDLSVINLCAANILHHASNDRDGAGRDISHMFKKQAEILKEWHAESDDITYNMNVQRSGDKGFNPLRLRSGAIISEEVFHDERETQPAFTRSKHLNKNPISQEGKVADSDYICEICSAHMPAFAIPAHERFHSMAD